MTRPLRVIGIGSAQGGDRIGWSLIEQLQRNGFERRFAPAAVELAVCRFPAQLMELLDGCRQAIILDAVRQPAGRIVKYTARDLRLSRHLHSSHGIGVGEALALAETLLPEAVAVTVLGIGVGPNDEAQGEDLQALAARLETWLQAELGEQAVVDRTRRAN